MHEARPHIRYSGGGRIERDVAPFLGDQGGNTAHTDKGGLRGAEAEMDTPWGGTRVTPGEGDQGDPWGRLQGLQDRRNSFGPQVEGSPGRGARGPAVWCLQTGELGEAWEGPGIAEQPGRTGGPALWRPRGRHGHRAAGPVSRGGIRGASAGGIARCLTMQCPPARLQGAVPGP